MFFEEERHRRIISRWIISIVSACVLIYLGVRHISQLASAVRYVFSLIAPLCIGLFFALVLNLPMRFFERKLFAGCRNARLKKAARGLSILLSVATILGILIGVCVLVVPELIDAATVLAGQVMNTIDQLAEIDAHTDYAALPFGEYLDQIDVDWSGIKSGLSAWFNRQRGAIVSSAVMTFSSVAGVVIDLLVSLAFSIYMLAGKEKLTAQAKRLIRVWIPESVGNRILHVSSVSIGVFQKFIVGQTMEAIILGSLCTAGMLILRLPYAPMVGALIGVTAFIPIVGAYLGALVGAFMILTIDPFKALVFLIFLLILQQVEGNLIYPKVVGGKIHLPAMWVLAAITIGGGIAGPIGMLFAVPVFSSAYELLREATEQREKRIE